MTLGIEDPARATAETGRGGELDSHMRVSAEILFAAATMSSIPTVLTDPYHRDNGIVFANKAFCNLTGYSVDEIVGRNCRFMQGALTDVQTISSMREAIAERRAISVKILNYRRDGSSFWNACSLGPIYGADGELVFFMASAVEIAGFEETERSPAQRQTLEKMSEMTESVAHDFRNSLQAIIGNLELLTLHLTEERPLGWVKNARDAGIEANKLTDLLLTFARDARLELE